MLDRVCVTPTDEGIEIRLRDCVQERLADNLDAGIL
jgi:hypothetical protein